MVRCLTLGHSVTPGTQTLFLPLILSSFLSPFSFPRDCFFFLSLYVTHFLDNITYFSMLINNCFLLNSLHFYIKMFAFSLFLLLALLSRALRIA